jgi:hypothetical protein
MSFKHVKYGLKIKIKELYKNSIYELYHYNL